jgi:hypothetical protein
MIGGKQTVSFRRKDVVDGSCIKLPVATYHALLDEANASAFFSQGAAQRVMGKTVKMDEIQFKQVSIAMRDVAESSLATAPLPPVPMVNYQYVVDQEDGGTGTVDEGIPSGKVHGHCILGQPALVPVMSENNDIQCINRRVVAPASSKVLDRKMTKMAIDFAKLVVPDHMIGCGVPLTVEEVAEKQTKPAQRNRNARELPLAHMNPANKVETFQKKETYGKGNDPRNISTCSTQHTLNLSRFCGPLKDYLQRFEWFMPCLKPEETARRLSRYIAKITRRLLLARTTDYSRFDGTLSEDLRRKVEFQIFLRFYGPLWFDELAPILECDINVSCRTPFGLMYNSLGSRLSGSPTTTIGNTLINAFADYVGYVLAGLTSEDAFSMIGPKFGDDAVTTTLCKTAEASELLGLKVKVNDLGHGEPIDFCSRSYPAPIQYLAGGPPLKKLLRNIVVTASGGTLEFHQKLWGRWASDKNVPVVSDLIRAYMIAYNVPKLTIVAGKEHCWSPEMLQRHKDGPYVVEEDAIGLMKEMYAEELELDARGLDAFVDQLRGVKTEADLLKIRITVSDEVITDEFAEKVMMVADVRTREAVEGVRNKATINRNVNQDENQRERQRPQRPQRNEREFKRKREWKREEGKPVNGNGHDTKPNAGSVKRRKPPAKH